MSRKTNSPASYRIFYRMTTLASAAICGVVALFLYQYVFTHGVSLIKYWYAPLSVWVFLFAASLAVGYRFFSLYKPEVVLWRFIAGGVIWIVSAALLFLSRTSVAQTLWTIVAGFSAGAIKAATEGFKRDFRLFIDEKVLQKLNRNLSATSACISIITAAAIVAFNIFLPSLQWVAVLILSVIMYVAVVAGYNQPLDFRTREKLVDYVTYFSDNELIKKDLEKKLIEPYNMRYGVKIISTSLKALLRLKIVGKENLSHGDFPSVFVCNHDAINGPVSAVTYLPTYYRVWIHDEMLDYDVARKNISHTLRALPRFFGKFLGGKMIDAATRFTCWALNSFNPVPVRRGTSREVLTTFIVSLQALQEGDNLLIFPETPGKGEITQSSDESIRSFYTGFAHLGKVYFDKCGKSLLFYPVYIDKKKRQFRIGEAVRFNPDLDATESKQIIAAELHRQMTEFSKK
ncbi:MAG: hypothetical protein J6Z27_03715 [Bacteroidales bacterium]|nr:hypothetical protein [Bacteroidales bacterium]